MDNQKFIIGSLAIDLKRVAIGYFNGSTVTAGRFFEEALKRKKELNAKSLRPYIVSYLKKLPELLNSKDNKKIAEDALMYSTIFQNYATHNFK